MKWTKEQIINHINANDHVLYGAIIALYNEQTMDEKISESTNHNNNRGFNGADAKIMTSLAKQLLYKKSLSDKQKYIARKRIMKYATQLTNLSNEVH